MKSDFRKYVLAHKHFQLSSYLEALAGSICFQLKDLANNMVFGHHHSQLNAFHSITTNKLGKLKRVFLHQLRDFLHYILVKSKRNLPIEPYQSLVSNLMLLIYVDRSKNEFIWTFDQRFGCCLAEEAGTCLYDQRSMVHTLIDKSYQLLKANQSMQSRWQEKNLIFNHAIWFEDHTASFRLDASEDFFF